MLPLGDSDKAFEFHPKAMLGTVWDDNPLLARDGSSADVYGQWGVGIELRAQGQDGWRGDLSGMLRGRSYIDGSREDELGGNADLRVQRRGETGELGARASYLRSSDPSFNKPTTIDRQTSTISLNGSAEGRRHRWSGSASLSDLHYLEETSSPDQRDIIVNGAWHMLGGAESRLGVQLELRDTDFSPSLHASDYRSGTLKGVWRHALGTRSTIELGGGATLRRHQRTTDGDPAYDDDVLLAPALSARLVWGWEDRSQATLLLTSDLADSISGYANASDRIGALGSVRIRLLDRLDFDALGWAIHREDSATGFNGIRETAIDLAMRAGLEYRLRDGFGLRPWIQSERHDFTSDNDYGRLQVALEAFAAF